MLLAFTDSYGIIYPFTALREVYHEEDSSNIKLYNIGTSDKIILRYNSKEDALKAYNRYIEYLTVPDPPSSPI